MSDRKKKRASDEKEKPTVGAAEESARQDEEPRGEPTETDELRAKAAEFEDKWLRALADLDNFRKRTARDRERDLRTAREGITLPLLDVLDDFDRALSGNEEGGDGFRKGMEMIRGKFVAVLEGLGVKGFASVGEPFDPERHHALQSVPAEGIPEGHVAAEIRKGYLSGDRVLRPALVAVAAPAAEGAGDEVNSKTSEDE